MRNAQNDPHENWVDREEFTQFRLTWIKALRRQGLAWEGNKAMRELKSVGALAFLSNANAWQLNELLGRIFQEIETYNENREQLRMGRLFLQELKRVQGFLGQLTERIKKQRSDVHHLELQKYLASLGTALEGFTKKSRKLRTLKRQNTKSPLTRYEKFFPGKKRIWLVDERIRLDTRLQVQMAKMFLFYLREYGVSHQTCARLVMLTYLSAEIAYEEQATHVVKIHNTGRPLTVRAVFEKIAKVPRPININR